MTVHAKTSHKSGKLIFSKQPYKSKQRVPRIQTFFNGEGPRSVETRPISNTRELRGEI